MRSTVEMLNGIDIYSLNLDDAQAPSWAAIRRADFVFVFLKTYEYREDDGTILLSNGAIDQVRTPAHLAYGFANRWPALAKAGFIRGTFDLVHHNAGSATAQATQVARIIQRFVPGDLGPSLDMEDRDLNHSHAKAPSYWVSFANEYLDAIETALGRQPIVYESRANHDGRVRAASGQRATRTSRTSRPWSDGAGFFFNSDGGQIEDRPVRSLGDN